MPSSSSAQHHRAGAPPSPPPAHPTHAPNPHPTHAPRYSGQGTAAGFIAEYYHHTFAMFHGVRLAAFPSFDLDLAIVITIRPIEDLGDMLLLAMTSPSDLLEMSKTTEAVNLGIVLVRVVVALIPESWTAFLQTVLSSWEAYGAKNVPLGEQAQSTDTNQLMNAARRGDVEKLKRLISAGADVNAIGKSKKTALHFAAAKGSERCLKVLLDHGAGVNAKDSLDYTPVHEATKGGHSDCLKLLLAHGAFTEVVSCGGQAGGVTALTIAKRRGDRVCALLLGGGKDDNSGYGGWSRR